LRAENDNPQHNQAQPQCLPHMTLRDGMTLTPLAGVVKQH